MIREGLLAVTGLYRHPHAGLYLVLWITHRIECKGRVRGEKFLGAEQLNNAGYGQPLGVPFRAASRGAAGTER